MKLLKIILFVVGLAINISALTAQNATFKGKDSDEERVVVVVDYDADEVNYNGEVYQIVNRPNTYNRNKNIKSADIECTDEVLNKVIFRYWEDLLSGKKRLYIMIEGLPMRIVYLN